MLSRVRPCSPLPWACIAPATPEEREIKADADARRDALFAAALLAAGNAVNAGQWVAADSVLIDAEAFAEWLVDGQ